MTREIKKLLDEAMEDLSDIIDYVHSESGDSSLQLWLTAVEAKFKNVRATITAAQQED